MKKINKISFSALLLLIVAVSCNNVKRTRGYTYMPDMADSRAYETYSVNPVFTDGQTNRPSVAGTVKRGEVLPFHIPVDEVGDTTNYFASRA
ncbi:MAG: cytochrome c, partial [Chitinophagaceae bacterium]|nr:cytochrome c [Chitinophagaceae bacterium]